MKPLTDEYILTEESRTQQYGFEVFQREDNGHHYFLFNDQHGRPALFSQGYAKASSRDKGIESVLSNAPLPERYEIMEEGEGSGRFFLVLKAANHQQIARSRTENSQKAINKLRDMFLSIGATARINQRAEQTNAQMPPTVPETGKAKGPSVPVFSELPETLAAEAGPERIPEEVTTVTIPSTRHLFHLTVYKDNGTTKLEHVLTGDTTVMPGIDPESIESFVIGHLPTEWETAYGRSSRQVATTEAELQNMLAPPQSLLERQMVVAPSEMAVEEMPVAVPVPAPAAEQPVPGFVAETIIVGTKNEEVPAVSFQEFLAPDGRLPQSAPAAVLDKQELLAVLRKPMPVAWKEPEKSMANHFIETAITAEPANSLRESSGEDVILAFAKSSASVRQFMSEQSSGEQREMLNAADVLVAPTTKKSVANDVVQAFIDGGTLPSEKAKGDPDSQILLSNVEIRPTGKAAAGPKPWSCASCCN